MVIRLQYSTPAGQGAERECTERQSEELFEAVVKTVRCGGKIDIRRNLVRKAVIVHIDGTYHQYRGTEFYYFLQRPMSDAEILEESIKSGLWINWEK